MNYDEEYWRIKAREAQEVAATYYAAAMRSDTVPARIRAWQAEAYDVHQKMMARLGWAEVERNNVRGRYRSLADVYDNAPRAARWKGTQ